MELRKKLALGSLILGFAHVVVAQTNFLSKATLTTTEAEARLRVAYQLARETNQRPLVEKVEQTTTDVKQALAQQKTAAAEELIRAAESSVGIDPGGWSMGGLPIFHPTAELLAQSKAFNAKLETAMASDDAAQVQAVVAELKAALGPQAGYPDARRKGTQARNEPVSEAQNALWFIRALESEGRAMRTIIKGEPLPDQMLRLYAGLVKAACEIRPTVLKHQPEKLPELDRLVTGACQIMLHAQQPDGHFPLPDLRGKNIRFGEMTDRLVKDQPDAVKDGWIVSLDPGGGMQFDTGECGVALLTAGKVYQQANWTKAGLRAADWALTQPCVRNFNYNAFSVSLLAHAYRETQAEKYLRGALHKFAVGVAPGQVENGRWIDAHNARTVYHLIILRALNDLRSVLPAEEKSLATQLSAMSASAVKTVLDEFEAVGVTDTSFALVELLHYEALSTNSDPRLHDIIEKTASVVRNKCVLGDRAKLGVAATELAVLHRAWK